MAKNPLKITDLSLRDGHQSIYATRMRTADMEPIAAEMNKVGFYSMEVWGGATFDVQTRFLNEDPWERPRVLKKLMPDTPLQMLLRGQNLVGYRNYADDVVEAFVHHAAEVGIDIFRVFDELNDERNFEAATKAIKSAGKHAQLSLSYSLIGTRLGGDVYNIDYFVNKAKAFESMGADSICIKDMAGLISPQDAYDLVIALKAAVKIPINLHSHYTSGMAPMSILKAIEAGVDIIDTAVAPLALKTSHSALEPILMALQGTDRDTGMELHQLTEIDKYFESILPKYRDYADDTKAAVIDTGVLEHQVPGGMISNLVSQLREADALDRIDEVYAELPLVRKEMGSPPLVTPTSQIVGIQAVQNVLFGRYKMVSGQVKDYFYGLYGKTPLPVDPEIQKIVLEGYERGQTPITCRAADALEPEMEKATAESKEFAKDIGDVLIYALYPTTGMTFLKAKHGMAPPSPTTEHLKTLDEIKREDELIAKIKAGKLTEPGSTDGNGNVRKFNVHVGGEVYNIGVESLDGPPIAAAPVVVAVPAVAAPAPVAQAAPAAAAAPAAGDETITAPMPGVIIRYEVKVGDHVNSGDTVVVLEAMKMDNAITAPISGIVKAVNYSSGDRIARDDVLAVIGA